MVTTTLVTIADSTIPLIKADLALLSFSATAEGADPPPQPIVIGNVGGSVIGTSNQACAVLGRVGLWVPSIWAGPGQTAIVPVNIRNANGLRIAASDIWLDIDST